jgi:hypothetical protein
MLELELATTEQIIAELAKRPTDFVLLCVPEGEWQADGYLAFSPHLQHDEVRRMLGRASRILTGWGDADEPFPSEWQDPDGGECGEE